MTDNKNDKAILAVSFGSTSLEAIECSIAAAEACLADHFPDRRVYRAFTSGIILKKLKCHYQLIYDNVEEAMERMLLDGIRELIVQPLHVVNGIENEQMMDVLRRYAACFKEIRVGAPLLTDREDIVRSAHIIGRTFEDLPADTALVLLGHGTGHEAGKIYGTMDSIFKSEISHPVFVMTLKDRPSFEDMALWLEETGCRKVLAAPFLVVAGMHAMRDLVGDNDTSVKSRLEKMGYEVECLLRGLGEYPQFREIYADHAMHADLLENNEVIDN